MDRPNLELFRVLFAYLIASQYRKERSVLGIPIKFQDQKVYFRYVYSRKSRRDQSLNFSIGRTMFCDVAEGPPIDFRRILGDVAIWKLVRDFGYFGEVFRFILSIARPLFIRLHCQKVADD